LDVFNISAPVLRTLTREAGQNGQRARVRDVRPGDETPSIFDQIHSPDSRVIFHSYNEKTREDMETPRSWERSILYQEADAAEDMALFPEEHMVDNTDHMFKVESGIAGLDKGAIDVERFIHDADTDEEFTDGEEEEYGEDDEDYLDGSEYEFDDPETDITSKESVMAEITQRFTESMLLISQKDGSVEAAFDALDSRTKDMFGLVNGKVKERGKESKADMEREWLRYIDREKAKGMHEWIVFRQC